MMDMLNDSFDLMFLDHDLAMDQYREHATGIRDVSGSFSGTNVAEKIAALHHSRRPRMCVLHSFNKYGVAPAILPALGFQTRTLGGEVVVFGTAGAMVTLGFKF